MQANDTQELQRPYWDARIYVYRVTSPQAFRPIHPIPLSEPLTPAVTVEDIETVQVQRLERVSGEMLRMIGGRFPTPYVPDAQLRVMIVRNTMCEFRDKTGLMEDARAFTVELMDDREDPMVPAYPEAH